MYPFISTESLEMGKPFLWN